MEAWSLKMRPVVTDFRHFEQDQDPDPHKNEKLDLDPDPHESENLDLYPH
jgi:hypothetical protein